MIQIKRYLKYIPLIVSLFLIVSMGKSVIELAGKGSVVDEIQERVKDLEKEQVELLELKKSVESDEFVEKEAREKLGLARAGEVIVILPSDDVLRKFAPSEEKESFVEDVPIYKRWMKMFF